MPPTPESTPPVRLRRAGPDDAPFLFELYRATRAEEVAAWGWDDLQAEAFLRLQWTAQTRDYTARYPGADHWLVVLAGTPIGRLWLASGADELRVLDLTLLPEHRSRGIGGALLRACIASAQQAAQPLRLTVARANPGAQRLYQRLGLAVVHETDTHVFMEYGAAPSARAAGPTLAAWLNPGDD